MEYERQVLSTDAIPPDELEHYPNMSTTEDALSILIEKEEREIFLQKFREAMQSLTPGQKQLIHKRVGLKMSDVEIARQEGVSAAAIHYRWKKLQKKLKEYLN